MPELPTLARYVLALTLAAPAAEAGVVKGQIAYPPPPPESSVTPPPLANWRVENGIVPPMPAPEAHGPVVVVLEPTHHVGGPVTPVLFEAVPLRLEPRVAVGQVGASVAILNVDKVPRTFFLRNGETFMPRETTPPGATRTVKFTQPGDYVIADPDHPHGGALLFVVASRWAARVDDKGQFTFDVPDGRYLLKAWYRGVWGEAQPVDIGHALREVTVKVNEPPPRPPGKDGK